MGGWVSRNLCGLCEFCVFRNGSVVAFVIFFVVLVLCSCGCVSFFDLFCGLCLYPCGVVECVFVFCGVLRFPVCVMDCGGPVWTDL